MKPPQEFEYSSDILISVIMTVWNREACIREAIDGILNQSHSNLELLILDDGSTDGTAEIVQSYDDDRIRLIRREHRGRSASLNEAVRIAEGAFLAIADSDDISVPERLSLELEYLLQHTDVGVVSSWISEFGAPDTQVRERRYPSADIDIRKLMPVQCAVCFGAAMIRSELFDQTDVFDISLHAAIDYDFLMKILHRSKFRNLERVLVHVRTSPDSISSIYSREQSETTLLKSLRYLNDQLSGENDSETTLQLKFQLARAHYYHGSMRDARRELLSLLKQQPFSIAYWRYLAGTLVGDALMSQLRRRGIASKLMWPARKFSRKYRYTSP